MSERGPASRLREPLEPDRAPTFPDLVYKEFLAALAVSVGLLAWALVADAPLRAIADPNRTENPAKAPWYFVGLQELLVYFDPWFAGVALPTLIIVGLCLIPYVDTSRSGVGVYRVEGRRLALSHFLFGFALWWLLIAVGQWLRGPNWQLYWPWESWAVVKPAEERLWSPPLWVGLPAVLLYFGLGLRWPARRWPWLRAGLGTARYRIVMLLVLTMYAVPLKILLRLLFHVRYVLVTPWFNI